MEKLFFGLMALALFLIVGDYITTVKGMDRGFVETNPLNRFLFRKLGLPVTTFLEAGGVLLVGCLLASKDLAYGVMFVSTFSAVQAVAVAINLHRLLKK